MFSYILTIILTIALLSFLFFLKIKKFQAKINELTEIKESEKKYRTIFNNIPTGITICDKTGNIIETNQAAETFLGISKELHEQLTIDDAGWNIVNSDGSSMKPDEYALAVAIKENHSVIDSEMGIIGTDDKITWLNVSAAPLNLKNLGGVVSYHDRTARKNAETQLKINQDRYLKAQELGHVGNWEYNLQTLEFWGSDEAKRIYGFNPDAPSFTTEDVESCIPERERVHQALIDLIENGKEYNLEFDIITNNTRKRKTIISIATLQKDAWNIPLKVSGVVQDITSRKIIEKQLKTSLNEKEILLRELYHRTKNNMQVISALMHLRSSSVSNSYILDTFRDIETKIQSMALVHQMLYSSHDLSKINLKDYIRDLVNLLKNSFDVSEELISFNMLLEQVYVSIDTAIPCGLVLNELVTNVLKHAFPDKSSGSVCLELKKDEDGTITLLMSDDGIGISKDLNLRQNDNLGTQTIYSIVENQLNGKITVDTSNGLSWKISFSDKQDIE